MDKTEYIKDTTLTLMQTLCNCGADFEDNELAIDILENHITEVVKNICDSQCCVTDTKDKGYNFVVDAYGRKEAFNTEVEQLSIDCNCGWLTCENLDCNLIRCKKRK